MSHRIYCRMMELGLTSGMSSAQDLLVVLKVAVSAPASVAKPDGLPVACGSLHVLPAHRPGDGLPGCGLAALSGLFDSVLSQVSLADLHEAVRERRWGHSQIWAHAWCSTLYWAVLNLGDVLLRQNQYHGCHVNAASQPIHVLPVVNPSDQLPQTCWGRLPTGMLLLYSSSLELFVVEHR